MGAVEQFQCGAEVRDRLGRALRDLRISVIDNCNLRCPYCMPQSTYGEAYRFLPEEQLLSFDEIERLGRTFARLGTTKIRITGGEPLLRKNLPDLIARLNAIDCIEDIALTTNGLLLPRLAGPLRAAGLDRITISLDSLDDAVFGQMSGRGVPVATVLRGLDAARDAGFDAIKINAVVQRGVNDATILDLVERFRGTKVIVRFIEYMDVGTRNDWRLDAVVPSRELRDRIHAKWPLRPLEANYRGEVASRYAFEDGQGEIGFVSSVTETFCGGCTRARLSADGKLYTCLFAGEGTDLRGAIRSGVSDTELESLVSGIWRDREDRYSELRASMTDYERAQRKVEMYEVGG